MADKYLARLEQAASRLETEAGTVPTPGKEWEVGGEEAVDDGSSSGLKVRVWVQSGAKPVERYMGVIEVEAGVEEVLKACYDFEVRLQWDDGISKASKVLEVLSEQVSVTYQLVDGRMGTSSREMINGRILVRRGGGGGGGGGGEKAIVAHNHIDYEDKKPVSKDIVRARNHDVGYVLESLGEHRTRVTWIVQTELNGWIGMLNIKKLTIQNLAALLKKLRAFLLLLKKK